MSEPYHRFIMAIDGAWSVSAEDRRSSYLLDSSFLSSRTRRHTSLDSTKRPNRPYRARSASNILDNTDDFHHRLYDPLLAPHLQQRSHEQDGLADLVDFLKNHAPPPDNFMSMPDDGADDERGRWLKWAKIAKRSKSTPRGPPQIRLPDTAVSGTTIGGHRHIAITIPLEAFPMGERPRSQYPVYSHHELRGKGHNPNPVRTVVNDKGVVTVLKTVNEDRKASLSSSRYSSNSYVRSGSLPRTPSRSRGNIQGFFATPPSRGSASVHHGEDGTGRETPKARPSSQAASSAFPMRVSSMANRALHQHISIDGMLSQPGSAGMGPTRSQSEKQKQVDGGSKTTAKDGWPLKEKKSVKVKPSPIAVKGAPVAGDENISQESGATILKENPLGPRQDDSGPPTPVSQSRRDRVRDRKRRDIEALMNKRQQGDSEETEVGKSQPSFSPIRVVVNYEPYPAPAEAPLTPSPTNSSPQPESKPQDEAVTGMAPAINDTAQPTPPLSAHNSPPNKHNSLDRTCLSRRREWKATREQERKTKEARAAVRARAKELAASVPEELRDNPQTLDKEILRLYEAYREHRFRDMERRVRRLERNGDVWLQALVPVLDNLNHTTTLSQEGLGERAYMSDDEPAAASRQNRECTSVPIRRANSSHRATQDGGLQQHLESLEEGDKGNRCGSAGSDEVTGLETIESLMRELAGAARLRQMRAGGLLQAY